MLSYHVFKTGRAGHLWLADNERSWTANFNDAAIFFSEQLAKDIGERETSGDDATLWVFGLCES